MAVAPDPPLFRGNLGLVALAGTLTVLALAVVGAAATVAYNMTRQQSAFDAAPVCTSAVDLSGCRFDGKARIVDTSNSYGRPSVDVQFDQLGSIYTSQLDAAYTSQWQNWQTNQVVDAEVWDGSLVMVAGLATTDNPDTFAVDGYRMATVGFAALSIALGSVLAWLIVLYRREMQARLRVVSGDVAGSKPMPLSPGARQILSASAGRPRLMVAWIMAAAVCIAIIVSAAWFVYGVPAIFYGYVWVACLGLGALLAWLFVHERWRSMQDLRDGVFIRASGSFSVRLMRARSGTMVVVSVAGRKLAGVFSDSLESVPSGSGSVDYLPHTGFLLEIRDESGSTLWPVSATPVVAKEPQAAAT